MEKMRKKIKNRIPELIVILISMVILGVGVSSKEGYHMDEILSYEMSNAIYNPWIVPTQPQGRLAKFVEHELRGDSAGETFGNLVDTVVDVLQNRGNSKLLSYKADVYDEPVWIDAETFEDYITVDDYDDFEYTSVYFNVWDDVHPPLYYMMLHTLSSVFKNVAEPFIGCSINMVITAGILIVLMKLGEFFAKALGMEEKARMVGIFVGLCYGLSTGAMASTLLIRMYNLLSFFCVALLLVHVKKWSRENGFAEHNKLLIAVTVLGFATQYFFLFYCLILAAVTAVLLFVKKRTKELICYIRSMVTAAVIGVVLCPFSFHHVFTTDSGEYVAENFSMGMDGFGTRLQYFGEVLSGRTFGSVLFIAILVIGITVGAVLLVQKGKEKNKEVNSEKGIGSLMWMLLLPAVGYFLLSSRMALFLVDRYIMAAFPFVILSGALLFSWLAVKVEIKCGKRGIVYVICGFVLLCQVWNLAHYDGSYLYKGYSAQRKIAAENAEFPCICVYDGVGFYENLLEFTCYEQTLMVTEEELVNRQDTASIEALDEVVLLIKPNVDTARVFATMEEHGFALDQVLFENGAYGDTLYMMRKSAN